MRLSNLNKTLHSDLKNNLLMALLLVAISLVLSSSAALAQKTEKGEEEEKKPAEMVEHSLQTEDGLQITVSYYESLAGMKSGVAVLLHDFGGNRMQFDPLARALQADGFTVIVPDLRGHGSSKKGRGQRTELNANRFKKAQFAAMVTQDMVAVREFIVQKNNDKKLNMDKMCILGSGMGATVGIKFTLDDWRNEPLNGNVKTGQDVKALIMLSPTLSFKGLKITKTDMAVAKVVSVFTLIGKKSPTARNSEKIYKNLSSAHRKLRGSKDVTPMMASLPTTLSGTKLLGAKKLYISTIMNTKKQKGPIDIASNKFRVEASISSFFQSRVLGQYKSSRWQQRESF